MNTVAISQWKQYYRLTKPRVVALIVFTALVGMLLSIPQVPALDKLFWSTLGIGLAAASAAAINHLLDQRIDALMQRTRHRPLPTGQLNEGNVLYFAITLAGLSMAMLIWQINLLTAVLTFVSLIGYAVIYTVYLKWATPQNIVIGGAAGAAPPLLGWTAITGEIHYNALLLFLIVFVWTPPHFWALAIYRRQDYANAAVPMLPVTHGVRFTRWHILFYTVLLVIFTLMPYLTGMSGLFYLGGMLVLNAGFLYYAVKLLRSEEELLALRMFTYSVIYLMMLFVFLLIDHYLPASGLLG